MNHYNIYGKNPVELVLVHGGPGARGSLEDLAMMLSKDLGVLEINQSKYSILALIEEMHVHITNYCRGKITLLGHSWGAWLIGLYTHKYPEWVKKLILVASGSFDEKYVKDFQKQRLNRLNEEEKKQYDSLMKELHSHDAENKDKVITAIGKLMAKLDTFASNNPGGSGTTQGDFLMFKRIWAEASELRKSGQLMDIIKEIKLPIHVIQGDYDSHGIEGILGPFQKHHLEFTYDVISRCGHYPWKEKYAKKEFLDIVLNQF